MIDSTTFDTDLHYTDKPFVLDVVTGIRVPRNGFKGYGDRYTVDDACLTEKNMAEFEITPEELLQLKLCFDRINRKSKREAVVTERDETYRSVATRYWQKRRDRLRALFNARYFRLRQLVIRTRYRYNMRPYIVTPPIRQCTHQYDTMLRRLCRLDGLAPHELQTKRVFIKHDRNWNSSQGGGKTRTRPRSSRMNNDALQRLWKTMNESELVNKSIKDQTQGGKSFLKQVVIPGKMLNCLYGKVLPDPTLRPDEIGIPNHVMEGSFKSADMNKVAAVVKRDPVFSSDAITMFTRVVRNPYPYVTLPSEIITNKQLDFDGDNVSIMMVHSGRCFVETLMRLSAKIGMYCYFYRTRLTFSQTNGFRVAGLLRHLCERVSSSSSAERDVRETPTTDEPSIEVVRQHFGKTFAHCHFHVCRRLKVLPQLNETLLSLAQQYGPFVAYGFLMNVRSLSFTGYNAGRVYPIGPEPRSIASHIAESGSKGTKEAVDCMFDMRATKESRSMETLEYAKAFIEAKTLIRKQGHNAKKMDSAFQNIVVDHDEHLVVRVNNIVYDLGHIVNYMQREWIMSDLTTDTILNGVVEDEKAFRRITLLGCGGETARDTRETPETPLQQRHTAPRGGLTSTDDSCFFYWDDVIDAVLSS